MRMLVATVLLIVLIHVPVSGGTFQQGYWGGSQTASTTTIEFGSPWVVRYRTVGGAYTADTLSWDPHNFDTARWDLDLGIQTNLGIAYAGYYDLRHDQPGGIPNWRVAGLELGLRGVGEGPIAVSYDLAVKPGEWLGLDTSIGLRWQMSPTTQVNVGFTDWRWTSSDGYLMNWSGPYLAMSF